MQYVSYRYLCRHLPYAEGIAIIAVMLCVCRLHTALVSAAKVMLSS